MAKQALLHVLEQTIGRYVENLDAQSLNVGIWNGTIELHNLQFDVDAINKEPSIKATPLEIQSGRIDSLQVTVPWTHLFSKSVCFYARGLHVIMVESKRNTSATITEIHDKNDIDWDKEARRQALETAEQLRKDFIAMKKMALSQATSDLIDSLDSADDLGKQQQKQQTSSTTSFMARLVRRIVENLRIEIQDVHISFQDVMSTASTTVTTGRSRPSAGLIFHNLSLQTTDSNGNPTFVDRSAQGKNPPPAADEKLNLEQFFMYKHLTLDGFGIYVDPAEDQGKHRQKDHEFVLTPVTFQAQLRQADSTANPQYLKHDDEYSKYQLKSELSSLVIDITKDQLEWCHATFSRITITTAETKSMQSGFLFPEYRPMCRITNGPSAKLWWQYAVRCIGRVLGHRDLWIEFYDAFLKRKKYVTIYSRPPEMLSLQERQELEELELDPSITIQGIMTWRTIAEARREKEEAMRYCSLPSATSNTKEIGTNKLSDANQDMPNRLTLNEISDLEQWSVEEFLFQGEQDATSENWKLADLAFNLSAFSVHLSSSRIRPITVLEMGHASVAMQASATGAYDFEWQLSSLEIQDQSTRDTLFPKVLTCIDEAQNLLSMKLSRTNTGDTSLAIKVSTLEMIASLALFQAIHSFASIDPQIPNASSVRQAHPIQELDANSSLTTTDFSVAFLEAWKDKTKKKSIWTVEVDAKAPLVVIPESSSALDGNVIVLDLGQLQVEYGKMEEPASTAVQWFKSHPKTAKAKSAAVDFGRLQLNNVSFLVTQSNQWRQSLNSMKILDNPHDGRASMAAIELITFDFGIGAFDENVPLICGFGIIPVVSLRLASIDVAKIGSVVNKWSSYAGDINNNKKNHQIQKPVQRKPERSTGQESLLVSSCRFSNNTTARIHQEESSHIEEISDSTRIRSSSHPFSDEVITINIAVEMKGLSMQLCDDFLEPIVRLDMDELDLGLQYMPKEDKLSYRISLSAEKYRFVLVDLGSQEECVGWDRIKRDSIGASPSAEAIFVQGKLNSWVTLSSDLEGDDNSSRVPSIEALGEMNDVEIFSVIGMFINPLQILDPADLSLNLSFMSTENGQKIVEIRAAVTPLDLSISMYTIALVNAILTSLVEGYFRVENGTGKNCVVPLGEDEAEQIKRVAAQLDEDAMQQDDVNGSGSSDGSEAIIDSSSNEDEDPASSDLLLRFQVFHQHWLPNIQFRVEEIGEKITANMDIEGSIVGSGN